MGNFNAQANEYGKVADELKATHEEQLKKLNQAYQSLKSVASLNGGFHIDQTSAKINNLLNTIGSDVLPALAAVFNLSESNMNKFVSGIKRIDKE